MLSIVTLSSISTGLNRLTSLFSEYISRPSVDAHANCVPSGEKRTLLILMASFARLLMSCALFLCLAPGRLASAAFLYCQASSSWSDSRSSSCSAIPSLIFLELRIWRTPSIDLF